MKGFFDQVWGIRYPSNSLRISGRSLKFGGMMHSTMEQIAIINGHVRPIFACSRNFQNRLRPGLRDDVTTLTPQGVRPSAWNSVGWCTVPWNRLLLKMAMLGQFLCVPPNFEIFHDRLEPGRWNWGNHIMAWTLVAWCSLPWSGALYEMATLWSRLAKAAVILWISCSKTDITGLFIYSYPPSNLHVASVFIYIYIFIYRFFGVACFQFY